MNIMICDDRAKDRKSLSDLLNSYAEKKNYKFTIAEYASGELLCGDQSVLEKCQLLFLDINTPKARYAKVKREYMLVSVSAKCQRVLEFPCELGKIGNQENVLCQIMNLE